MVSSSTVDLETLRAYRRAVIDWARVMMLASASDAGRDKYGPELQRAERELTRSESSHRQLPLVRLTRTLRLGTEEVAVLRLLWAITHDAEIANWSAKYVQDDSRDSRPTLRSLQRIFRDAKLDLSVDLLSPHRSLRAHRLLDVQQRDDELLDQARLALDERLATILDGHDDTLDHHLSLLFKPDPPKRMDRSLSPSQQLIANRIRETFPDSQNNEPSRDDDLPSVVIQIAGPSLETLSNVVRLTIDKLQTSNDAPRAIRLFHLDASSLPEHAGELAQTALLWKREARFCRLALAVSAWDLDSGEDSLRRVRLLRQFLLYEPGMVFVLSRAHLSGLGSTDSAAELERPTVTERRNLWGELLDSLLPSTVAPQKGAPSPSSAAAQTASELAAQFQLEFFAILKAWESVVADDQKIRAKRGNDSDALSSATVAIEKHSPSPSRSGADRHEWHDRLWAACRELARPRLETLAIRIETSVEPDDLILPDQASRQLAMIVSQARQRTKVFNDWGFGRRSERGLGLGALFTGESGTGKTLAAEMIALQLQLDLYRTDLSSVVNKYVGETEKNLRRLFDAAEEGGVVLFFDEADSLFGKRSEVRDSHDRYANIQIDYLLQRMESYQGIVILATNFQEALDAAFLRRLRFVIRFPVPDRDLRLRIWQRMFAHVDRDGPDAMTPVRHSLSFRRLAELDVTGGTIRNMALGAAFIAADRGSTTIGMEQAQQAARLELDKLGRPTSAADFLYQPSVHEHAAREAV